MKAIHLKCEDRLNLTCVKMPVFESGYWDISESDAAVVVGGMIYMHQTKNELSYMGGVVQSFRIEVRPELAHATRIIFVFESTKEGRGAKWKGADHAMAWYSGVVDG
ncbi:hypothetical protein H261_17748 [Paramagnetospirillum caucaseum]|uniref:Uncharacterized protein n=1 Tax=Paramagnetospirillum caucaseum TaxID=1244869 RepID=M2Z2M4_9PROT|nr:hypothetical protein [Paramagnetospirillum caucaseum]EME68570.1 hypothetical protein H261_17748 [Paramagnetospirillum caucaseum]